MRLFIGVWLSDPQRDEVAALINELRRKHSGWRWTSPNQLHFTLKFLGEVDPGRLAVMKSHLTAVAQTNDAFDLTLGELGIFPPTGPPRVLWVGAASGAAALTALAGQVETVCQTAGFAAEPKPFRPHLTIARAKADPGVVTAQPRGWGTSTRVSGFSLIESKLQPAGSVYTTLAEFRFQP